MMRARKQSRIFVVEEHIFFGSNNNSAYTNVRITHKLKFDEASEGKSARSASRANLWNSYFWRSDDAGKNG